MAILRWTCLVALVVLLSPPSFAQDGQCNRCGVRVGGVAPGQWTGMSRAWRGLCELCKDPERRCDSATDALRERIRQGAATLRQFQEEARQLEASADADELYLTALRTAILDLEIELADMRALLARLERECAGEAASDMAENLNPGTRTGTGSNEDRDGPTGSEPVDRTVDLLDQVNPAPGPGSAGSNVGRDSPTGSTGSQATASPAAIPAAASPEAAYLQGLRRYAQAGAPLPRTNQVRLSEQGLPEPVLAEVPSKLPPLEQAELHAANAVACAEAFDRTRAEALAALQRGDRARAEALLQHALLLAVEGQGMLRDARQERLQALRDLRKLAALVTGPPAEIFAAWLARIRAEGLPADLPGLTPEQAREAQSEILALDPREAALAHYRAKADLEIVDSKPPDDAEWDLASVSLAHRIAGRRR